MRGRSTIRGGFACETWRDRVRDVAGSRARSPGFTCEVWRVGVSSLPGIALTSSWTSRRVGRVRVSYVAGARAGRAWSRLHARRNVVPGHRGHRTTVGVTRSAIDRDGVVDGPGCGVLTGWTYPPPPLAAVSTACAHGRAALFPCSPARRVPVVGRYGHCRTSLWTLPDVAMDLVRRHLEHCRPWLWTLSGATLDLVRRHYGHCPVAVGRSHGRVFSSSAYRLPSATLRAGRTTSLLRRSPYLAIPSNSSATPHENPGTTSPPSSVSVSRSHRTGELLATIITVRRTGSTTQISGVPHAR